MTSFQEEVGSIKYYVICIECYVSNEKKREFATIVTWQNKAPASSQLLLLQE